MERFASQSVYGKSIDWEGFKTYLQSQYSKSYAKPVYNYSRKYVHLISKPHELLTLGPQLRLHVMKALTNLSKFTGYYEHWKQAVKSAGLKWSTTSAPEIFKSILKEGKLQEEAREWLRATLPIVPRRYALPIVFARLTGLRADEACKSIQIIHDEGLDNYYDQELSALLHINYPRVFLRRTKNAFLSFVTPQLLDTLRAETPVSMSALSSYLKRRDIPRRMKTLRKDFSTSLRGLGVPHEMIDILQGRVGPSVFVEHYYRPGLRVLGNQVLEATKPLEEELLKSLS